MEDSTMYKRFGKMIAKMRLELGYRQEDVAKKLNISKSAYGNYERGERKIPFSQLIAISNFFNIDLNEFIKDENENQWVNQISIMLQEEFDGVVFTSEEMTQLMEFTKYLLSKRNGETK